jgi:uncharacterized protein YjbJ (UPF0337 family)
MTSDKVKGKARQATGSAKETAGKATGNEKLEGQGKVDKARGKGQEMVGTAKDKVRQTRKKVS